MNAYITSFHRAGLSTKVQSGLNSRPTNKEQPAPTAADSFPTWWRNTSGKFRIRYKAFLYSSPPAAGVTSTVVPAPFASIALLIRDVMFQQQRTMSADLQPDFRQSRSENTLHLVLCEATKEGLREMARNQRTSVRFLLGDEVSGDKHHIVITFNHLHILYSGCNKSNLYQQANVAQWWHKCGTFQICPFLL